MENQENTGLKFAIFFLAYALIVGGVLYGMSAAGLGATPIVVTGLILSGGGLLGAWSRTVNRGEGAAE